MELADINKSCKSKVFKDIVSDIMYSFRVSVKNLTEVKTDITLNKIRITPLEIPTDIIVLEGKIKSLVGGRISCALEKEFITFLGEYIIFDNNYEPNNYGGSDIEIAQFFMENFFDIFNSVSKNGILNVSLNKSKRVYDWNANLYYIQYNFKVANNPHIFKLNISVDELTSLYFSDN